MVETKLFSELTEYDKDKLRLKVKKEHSERLSKQLAEYLDNKGPISDKRQANEAASVRDELNEEIAIIEERIKKGKSK